MSRRQEVADAILRILRDEVPEIPVWRSSVTGAGRSKDIEGTVSCDRVRFTADAKGSREATADFSVYIVDNALSKEVENLADKADKVLTANPTLDNWAADSKVKEIIFGAPPGKPEVGLALIELEVTFDTTETTETEE